MKKWTLFIAVMTLIGAAYGQDLNDAQFNGRFGERVKTMKITFITNKLELTPTQAEKFWPIYNENQTKQQQLRKSYGGNRNISLMSDDEVERHIERRFELDEKLLNLKKEYFQKLKTAISIRQIANLVKVEREFKTKLLREIQQRKNQRQGNRNG